MTRVLVERVQAGYGRAVILRDVDLDIETGTLMAVLGASGSGKTTLLRVLAGFLRPSSGSVTLGERVVAANGVWVPPERRRIGIVPQEGALFPHLDVAGNVGFGLPRGSGERVEEMLELVGLGGLGAARPQELSGGQQQRVALARALAPRPDIVLLDEPFAALDAELRVQLRQEVRSMLQRAGATAVLVTHDQDEALSMADVVAVMRDGRVAQVDTPDRLYERPVDLATARFVGDAVELAATVSEPGWVHCDLGRVAVLGDDQRDGTVVLRPEQLALVAEPVAGQAADGAPGRIVASSYYGHDRVLVVALDTGLEVSVRVPGAAVGGVGDRVRVVVGGPGLLFPA